VQWVVGLYVETDDGTMLNINLPGPSAPVGLVITSPYTDDYYAGLLSLPSISLQSEDSTGAYVIQNTSVTVDNAPWAGNVYGFWDAPMPVTLRGKTITSWYRRRVEFRLSLLDGTLDYIPEPTTLARFLIEGIKTGGGTAVLSLASPAIRWNESDASLVKDGTKNFNGVPAAFLMRRLIKSSTPTAVPVIPEFFTTGDLEAPMVASLGPCPGSVSVDGVAASVGRWIGRCIVRDLVDLNILYFGFEVCGNHQRPDGAIAKYDTVSGLWTILAGPLDLPEIVPVQIVPWSDGLQDVLHVCCAKETLGVGLPESLLYLMTVSTTVVTTVAFGTYVPGHYYTRLGVWDFSGPGGCSIGSSWSGSDVSVVFYGEPILLPFGQVVEYLGQDRIGAITWAFRQVFVNGLLRAPEQDSPRYDVPTYDPCVYGNTSIGMLVSEGGSVPSGYRPLMRFFLHWGFSPPVRFLVGAGNAVVWVGCDGAIDRGDYTVNVAVLPFASVVTHHFPPNPTWPTGSEVTAWCFIVSGNVGLQSLMVAGCRWSEDEAYTDPGCGPTSLYMVTFNGAYDSAPCTGGLLWSGSNAAWTGVIVRLWMGYTQAGTAEYGKYPRTYVVATVVRRDTAKLPMYGLGVWSLIKNGWLTLYNLAETGYNGPVSGAPFDGFTEGETDSEFYFHDQAAGNLWKGTVNDSSSVSWVLANDGMPSHGSEHAVTSPSGCYLPSTTTRAAMWFWQLSPGPSGDTQLPAYPRVAGSYQRLTTGNYPLVRFSQTVPDCVEEADFSGMTTWAAVKALLETVPDYRMLVGGADGEVLVWKPTSTGTTPVLVPVDDGAVAVWEDGEIPVVGEIAKELQTQPISSVVEIVPWGVQPLGTSDPTVVVSSASKFAGNWLHQIKCSAAVTVAVTCIQGGDITAMSELATAANRPIILLRWSTILPEMHAVLALPCENMSVRVVVNGLRMCGASWFCGDVEVRAGDRCRVGDGEWGVIDAIQQSVGTNGQAILVRSSPVGVTAGIYSDVTIEAQDKIRASDCHAGLTTVSVAASSAEATISVASSKEIRRGMVLMATVALKYSEMMLVVAVNPDGTLTVERGFAGSTPVALAVGCPLQGYIWVAEPDKLYPAGNTGFSFGLTMRDDPGETYDPANDDIASHDTAARSVVPGDGLILRSEGLGLQAYKGSRIRSVDAASVAQWGSKTFTMDSNKFVDPIRAKVLSKSILNERVQMRTMLSGLTVPLNLSVTVGSTVFLSSERFLPGQGLVAFIVTGSSWNLQTCTQSLTLRSVSGTRVPAAEPVSNVVGSPWEIMVDRE
jgi:hypothetical protein